MDAYPAEFDAHLSTEETESEETVTPLDASDDRWLQAVQVSMRSIEGRKREVQAAVVVPVSPEKLWQVLTDYEHLADFIPNLTSSHLLPHPEGGIRLEQIGGQRLLKINFSARVVLDMTEHYPHRIDFAMVEGDFKEFSGYWALIPQEKGETELQYYLEVRPKLTMPVQVLECRLNIDLPRNLVAIYQRSLQF